MTKWEYLAVEIKSASFRDDLNAIGQVGWELVHITYQPSPFDVYHCIFKRPVQS